MPKSALFALPLGLALSLPVQAADPVPVMATVGMIGDLAAQVGGDCARVDILVPPGADPHLFRPRPSDVQRLSGAGVIFHLGLNLEGKLGDVLGALARDRLVVELGATLPPEALILEDGTPDPHVWMAPALWAQTLPAMAQAMGQARPDCAADMTTRAQALAGDLAALEDWAAQSLASIPEPARVLVTAHDAFGYFARAFDLRQEAIQGFSTESEASVADIAAVAQVVRDAGVPTVFVETTINPRTIAALVEAVQARGGTVQVGAPLFSDSMGDAGTPEGSYIGMIRANVLAITEGLGGTAAPWPTALAPWAEEWNLTP